MANFRTPELREAIIGTAKEIGIDPVVLATVISYETGGTMDPWKKGPTTKWGTHFGLIQWGGPQRNEYGITKGMSVTDQVKKVGEYLVDRGVKPGMSLPQVYSAINAGTVGRLAATDAKAGGMPGTVAQKAAAMQREHMPGMERFINGGAGMSQGPTMASMRSAPPLPNIRQNAGNITPGMMGRGDVQMPTPNLRENAGETTPGMGSGGLSTMPLPAPRPERPFGMVPQFGPTSTLEGANYTREPFTMPEVPDTAPDTASASASDMVWPPDGPFTPGTGYRPSSPASLMEALGEFGFSREPLVAQANPEDEIVGQYQPPLQQVALTPQAPFVDNLTDDPEYRASPNRKFTLLGGASGDQFASARINEATRVPAGPYGSDALVRAAMAGDVEAYKAAQKAIEQAAIKENPNLFWEGAANKMNPNAPTPLADAVRGKIGEYLGTLPQVAPGAVRQVQGTYVNNPAFFNTLTKEQQEQMTAQFAKLPPPFPSVNMPGPNLRPPGGPSQEWLIANAPQATPPVDPLAPKPAVFHPNAPSMPPSTAGGGMMPTIPLSPAEVPEEPGSSTYYVGPRDFSSPYYSSLAAAQPAQSAFQPDPVMAGMGGYQQLPSTVFSGPAMARPQPSRSDAYLGYSPPPAPTRAPSSVTSGIGAGGDPAAMALLGFGGPVNIKPSPAPMGLSPSMMYLSGGLPQIPQMTPMGLPPPQLPQMPQPQAPTQTQASTIPSIAPMMAPPPQYPAGYTPIGNNQAHIEPSLFGYSQAAQEFANYHDDSRYEYPTDDQGNFTPNEYFYDETQFLPDLNRSAYY